MLAEKSAREDYKTRAGSAQAEGEPNVLAMALGARIRRRVPVGEYGAEAANRRQSVSRAYGKGSKHKTNIPD